MTPKTLLVFGLLLTSPVFAAEGNLPKCGGTANGKTLEFKLNPLGKIFSAYSSEDRLMIYIDLNSEKFVKVAYGETITDKEWEGLDKLRQASTDKETYDLITRLGSGKITQVWLGWTADNYLHFESTQRDYSFNFSCQK